MVSPDPGASAEDPLVVTHGSLHPGGVQPPSPANLPPMCICTHCHQSLPFSEFLSWSQPNTITQSCTTCQAWQATSNSAWDLCIQMTCATHATSFLSSVATASATLGSPTGPVPSTTSAPVPDLGSTPDPFVMMSLLEVWLQGVSSNITSSVMDPLRHLECHVTSLVAAVSASPTPTQTATSSRPLGAPPLPTFTPAPALPVEPSLAPNNPGESSVRHLFPWIPAETINAVYKDLLRPGNLSKLCNATVANPSGEKAVSDRAPETN